MQEPVAEPFKRAVMAAAGMSSSKPTSLMSSLPSELTFNDLRDSGKRHCRQERTNPVNLHCVAAKSCQNRTKSCSTVSLDANDWSTPMERKAIKQSVHSALRQTDVSLGISSEGLTKHPKNVWYTKPHILCQRLSLLMTLRSYYEKCTHEDPEENRHAVLQAFQHSWTNTVVPMHCFVSFKDTPADNRNAALVIRAGPFNLLVLDCASDDGKHFNLLHGYKAFPREIFAEDMLNVLVASATPVAKETSSNSIAYEMGEWVELPEWVADKTITQITAAQLIKICSKLKVAGHSQLDHRHRVELFLRWMGRSEEYIEEVLNALPIKQRKVKDPEDPMKWLMSKIYADFIYAVNPMH